MKYKLLVLDIDGTVTNSQKQVSEKTREAVIRLQEKGGSCGHCFRAASQGVSCVAQALDFQTYGSYILLLMGHGS